MDDILRILSILNLIALLLFLLIKNCIYMEKCCDLCAKCAGDGSSTTRTVQDEETNYTSTRIVLQNARNVQQDVESNNTVKV